MTDINTLEENVVKICSDLIKIDTTNFGNNESVGENIAAEYVSEFLNALKIENKIVGPDNKRCSVLARIQGTNNELSDLVLHGHLDVVPVEKEKWTKEAFAAVIEKDLLWGRGAVDMKNGNAMILGSIAQLIKEGWRPKRNITIAMFADEEAGGKYGSHYVVNNHGEYFENASEAVGEVGGFSHTLSNGVRLYLIETAQKGIAWMKLTAKGTAGHGSMINSDNAISKISRAINSLTNYKFPITLRDAVLHLLQETALATNQQFNPKDPEKIILQLGTLAKLVSATTKNTVNPTMLNAGYKVNVIPGEASAYVDGRFLPGNQESFLNEIKTIVGEEIDVEAETFDVALEAPFENDLVKKMITSLEKEDPLARVVPYMLSGGTDAKAMSKFGIKAYGFTPLMLPNDLDFTSLFHGHDERIPIDSLKFGARTMYRFLKEI